MEMTYCRTSDQKLRMMLSNSPILIIRRSYIVSTYVEWRGQWWSSTCFRQGALNMWDFYFLNRR